MKKPFLLIVIFFFGFFACNDDDDNLSSPIILGTNYYPIAEGQVKIFQVDSVLYDDFSNTVDSFSFFRKEEITGSFIDGAGRENFITALSTRKDSLSNWTLIKNFIQIKLRERVERLEDNLTLVVLVFPFVDNKRWDVNVFNVNDELIFSYKNMFRPFELNGQRMDSVVTVAQLDTENLIQRIFAEEKYAPNYGLIYRQSINLNTDIDGRIRSGFESKSALIEMNGQKIAK